MTFLRSIKGAATACGFIAIAFSAVVQGEETFKARLSAVPRGPGMAATIAGTGSVTAVLAGTKLTVTGSFEGLRSPATIARLHRGVATGVRGSALQELTVSHSTSGAIKGSIDLTPFQVGALRKGQLYVQIHSEKAPEGNLWGWLLP